MAVIVWYMLADGGFHKKYNRFMLIPLENLRQMPCFQSVLGTSFVWLKGIFFAFGGEMVMFWVFDPTPEKKLPTIAVYHSL